MKLIRKAMLAAALGAAWAGTPAMANDDAIAAAVNADYDGYLDELFVHFHLNPELSFLETNTAARMAAELRAAGVRAEVYVGGSGMKAQMKYADKRSSPIAVICGGDERARGEVTVKDLVLGAELSKKIDDNAEWRQAQPAQTSVPRGKLVEEVKRALSRK